jgi:hypothetical protein
MIKALKKLGIEGPHLSNVKAMYDKLIANNILNEEKLKAFLLKTGTRQDRNETRVFTLTTFIQYNIGIPSQGNKTGKRNKRNSNREGRNQTISICRYYDLIPERPIKNFYISSTLLAKYQEKKINCRKISSFSIHQQ